MENDRNSCPREVVESCPSYDSLADCSAGLLSKGATEGITRHAAECSLCSYLLERVSAFERDENAETPEWPEVSSRLQARFARFLNSAEANPRKPRGIWRVVWDPVFAYFVAIALVYPAGRGLFLSHHKLARTAPMESVRLINLDATRSARFGSPPSPGTGLVALSFFVPVREGFLYSAELIDGARNDVLAGPLSIRSYDGLGNFVLVCPQIGSHPGSMTLRVTEDGEPPAVPRIFSFPFQP